MFRIDGTEQDHVGVLAARSWNLWHLALDATETSALRLTMGRSSRPVSSPPERVGCWGLSWDARCKVQFGPSRNLQMTTINGFGPSPKVCLRKATETHPKTCVLGRSRGEFLQGEEFKVSHGETIALRSLHCLVEKWQSGGALLGGQHVRHHVQASPLGLELLFAGVWAQRTKVATHNWAQRTT